MKHARAGKKLGRDSAHRKALYSNLAGALITHGRIQTTEAKAKAVKPFAEKMITLGKRGDLHARRKALAELRSQDVVHNLFAEVAPRFAERPGGYTRIIKLGQRQGDAAEMVYLELVDYEPENALASGNRVSAAARQRGGWGRDQEGPVGGPHGRGQPLCNSLLLGDGGGELAADQLDHLEVGVVEVLEHHALDAGLLVGAKALCRLIDRPEDRRLAAARLVLVRVGLLA